MAIDERVRCCPDGLVTDRRRRIKVLDRHTGGRFKLLGHATERCPFSAEKAPILADPKPERTPKP